MNNIMTLDILTTLLNYNPETGKFTWNINTAHTKKFKLAGHINHGYVRISIKRKLYFAHQLAWLYVYGEWPDNQLDHINGIRDDNRIENLRKVNNRINSQNKSIHRNGKLVGATKLKTKTKYPWQARININGKSHFLGNFKTDIEAHNAYIKATQNV
jgi:hypothetical protein